MNTGFLPAILSGGLLLAFASQPAFSQYTLLLKARPITARSSSGLLIRDGKPTVYISPRRDSVVPAPINEPPPVTEVALPQSPSPPRPAVREWERPKEPERLIGSLSTPPPKSGLAARIRPASVAEEDDSASEWAKIALASERPPLPANLLGTWSMVRRDRNGELNLVEFRLDKPGRAKVTKPGAAGKTTSLEFQVRLVRNQLRIVDSAVDREIGKVVEVNARQLVIERMNRQLTFVR